MNESMPDRRPSLFDLWTVHHFALQTLAARAEVPEETIHAMLGNKPVARAEAEKILITLSALLHQQYTLETVYVALTEEKRPEEHQSAVALLMQQIQSESDAGHLGLYGLSQGGAQHQVITRKLERIYENVEAVHQQYGEEAAIQVLIAQMDEAANTSKTSLVN